MSGRTGNITSGPGRTRRLLGLLGTAAVVVSLALAGCGSESDSAGTTSTGAQADAPVGPERAAPGAVEAPAQPPAGQPAREPATDLSVGQRSIVYTGSITVRVDDVDAKAGEAARIVTEAGGFLGGDNRNSDESRSEATLQLRIPADRFASVVDRLAELGETLRREVSTEDVTEETLDLDARIATQRARVDSGRRLLAQAKTLSELVMLESELAKRESDLASLEAKKRRLADLTALSTVTVILLGPNAQPTGNEAETGFLAGLKGGWEAFLASLRVLLTVLGALLPWVVALGLPAAGVLWLARRLRHRRVRPVPVGAMPSVPAQAGTDPLTRAPVD